MPQMSASETGFEVSVFLSLSSESKLASQPLDIHAQMLGHAENVLIAAATQIHYKYARRIYGFERVGQARQSVRRLQSRDNTLQTRA